MVAGKMFACCLAVMFLTLLLATTATSCTREERQGVEFDMDLRACIFMWDCPSDYYGWNTLNNRCTGYVYRTLLAARGHEHESAEMEAFYYCQNRAADCEDYKACTTLNQAEWEACLTLVEGNGGYCLDGTSFMCSHVDGEWLPDQQIALPKSNCKAVGLTCTEGPSSTFCGGGPCDPESYEPHCEGELLKICMGDQIKTIDCKDRIVQELDPDSGSSMVATNTCGDRSDGQSGFLGEGESCDTASFENHCEGHVLVSCTGGRVARVDCRDVIPGTTCSEEDETYGLACVPEYPECDPTMDNLCRDGVITFCAFGKIMSLDCRTLGFTGCLLGNTLSGQLFAECTMDQ